MVETELKDLTDNLKTAIQAQIKVRIIFFFYQILIIVYQHL